MSFDLKMTTVWCSGAAQADGPPWTGQESPTTTEGTCRLRRAVTEKIAAKLRGKPLPPEQVERRRRTALELDLGRNLKRAREARAWPAWQLGLLGTALDEEVAARIGRSVDAVRRMREKHGIPNPSGHGWTEGERALLGTAPDEEVAARIGRTPGAVCQKRCKLEIPTFRGRRFRQSGP